MCVHVYVCVAGKEAIVRSFVCWRETKIWFVAAKRCHKTKKISFLITDCWRDRLDQRLGKKWIVSLFLDAPSAFRAMMKNYRFGRTYRNDSLSLSQDSLVYTHTHTHTRLLFPSCLLSLHNIPNSHTASNLGKECQSHDSDCNGDFIVAGNGSLHDQLAHLALDVKDAAAIKLAPWATANAGQHGGAKLEAEFAVEAANTSLSGATKTVGVHVEATVGAANGAAQHNVFFIYGVVKHDGNEIKCVCRERRREGGS